MLGHVASSMVAWSSAQRRGSQLPRQARRKQQVDGACVDSVSRGQIQTKRGRKGVALQRNAKRKVLIQQETSTLLQARGK
jgi:hypothetical protein